MVATRPPARREQSLRRAASGLGLTILALAFIGSVRAWSAAPRPVYDNGVGFFVTGHGQTELMAVRLDGQGDVTDSHVLWKLNSMVPKTASPILVELAQCEHPPERLVATLQWEVARRIEAGPGNEHYGVLGLLLRLRYDVRGSFKIPPTCFFPSPDVDSACIILIRRVEELLPFAAQAAFTRIVKRAFSQRRKMMFKLLKQDWPEEKLTAAFAELNISRQERAE